MSTDEPTDDALRAAAESLHLSPVKPGPGRWPCARKVVAMRMRGWSPAQIAKRHGITRGYVYKTLSLRGGRYIAGGFYWCADAKLAALNITPDMLTSFGCSQFEGGWFAAGAVAS